MSDDQNETIDLGDGIKLTPVNPTAAAVYGVLRTLIASAGIIGAIWHYAATEDLTGLYAFFHSPSNASALAGLGSALVAAGCMAWGFWKKRRGKITENTLKAAVVSSAVTQTPAALPSAPAVVDAVQKGATS